jgi:hypothetical protein
MILIRMPISTIRNIMSNGPTIGPKVLVIGIVSTAASAPAKDAANRTFLGTVASFSRFLLMINIISIAIRTVARTSRRRSNVNCACAWDLVQHNLWIYLFFLATFFGWGIVYTVYGLRKDQKRILGTGVVFLQHM